MKWSRGPLVSHSRRLTAHASCHHVCGDVTVIVDHRSPLPHMRSPRHPYPRRRGASQQHLLLLLARTALSSLLLAEPPFCAVPLPCRRATRRSNRAEHLSLESLEPSSASQARPRREPSPFCAARLPPTAAHLLSFPSSPTPPECHPDAAHLYDTQITTGNHWYGLPPSVPFA
jgi:hypothetical protein